MGKHKHTGRKELATGFAAGCWKLYGKICRKGWRKEYAAHMRKNAGSAKAWDRERKQLWDALKKTEPQMRKGIRGFMLKLKMFRFRVFSGAMMVQDSLDQIHTPYLLLRRLVTNARTNFITRFLCTKEMIALCDDKAASAAHWDAWMNRNWKALSPEEPLSREDLDRLLNGKTKLVVKPLTSYGGKGVEVLDTAERFASPEECLDYLNGLKKRYIAEEYVEQKGFIHDLNPSSVNTVRIVTVQHPGGELELKNAYLRVGREGSPVDNVTSGGWFYVIDHRTGMMREGRDRKDQCIVRYRKGKDPAPVKVPRWEEAVEFCLSAHRHAPEGLNYIGWDVSISDDGLKMIEVNPCPGLVQPYDPREKPWKEMRKLLDEFA